MFITTNIVALLLTNSGGLVNLRAAFKKRTFVMFHVVIEGTPHNSCSLECITLALNGVFWPGDILIDEAMF